MNIHNSDLNSKTPTMFLQSVTGSPPNKKADRQGNDQQNKIENPLSSNSSNKETTYLYVPCGILSINIITFNTILLKTSTDYEHTS